MKTTLSQIPHCCSNSDRCNSITCKHKDKHLPENTNEHECYKTVGCAYYNDSICIKCETDWDT